VCKKIIFRCFGVPTINEFAGGMILRPFWTVPMGNIGQGAAAKRRSFGRFRKLHQPSRHEKVKGNYRLFVYIDY